MNSKKFVIAALAATAVAGAIATGAVGADSGGTSMTLKAKATGGTPLDLGRRGISTGDQYLEHGTLTGGDGKAAGRFQMVTQLVSRNGHHGSEQSSMTLYLAGGEIEVIGGHATTARFSMPV